MHKSGFVNIIGNPNVGKSTIMNELVGEKLSIITSKSQTTRHRIMGIVSGDDFQIVYSDTPGILKPNYKLQEAMMKYVSTALKDADVIIYVTDVVEKVDKNPDYLQRLQDLNVPILLLINKIDLSDQEIVQALVNKWKTLLPKAEIIPMSAKEKFNVGILFDRIMHYLPEGEAFYPKEDLTNKSERFFVQEIIREKILNNYTKEIPYSVEVEVEEFKETEKIINIRCIIYVARDSQKGIIIGHQGKMLKRVGTQARKDIEDFFEKQVFLETYVKVNKDWRDKDRALKSFGYDE